LPKHNRESLLAVSRSFMECRLLISAAELDIFGYLATPLTADQLACKIDADVEALTIFLDALAGLGFLSKTKGAYQTPPELVGWLTGGSEESILASLRHSAHMWGSWSRLSSIVKLGRAKGQKGGILVNPSSWQKDFIGAMKVGGDIMADKAVAQMNVGGAKNFLDIGGEKLRDTSHINYMPFTLFLSM
jgi:hypothetical protein